MHDLMRLHEQIASDEYWQEPVIDPPITEAGERIPFLAQVGDAFWAGNVLNGIDAAYYKLKGQGCYSKSLAMGALLATEQPGDLLKVVEDMRIRPKRSVKARPYVSYEAFDTTGEAMVEEVLFAGPQVGVKVETSEGSFDVARRVLYVRNSHSGRQLTGKDSELLGRGNNKYGAIFMGHHPIGRITRGETANDFIEKRIAAAAIIRAAGRSSRSRVRFGAQYFLNPNASHA